MNNQQKKKMVSRLTKTSNPSLWNALKTVISNLDSKILWQILCDIVFLGIVVTIVHVLSKKLDQLAQTLSNVDLTNLMGQSNAELAMATATLKNFVYGIIGYSLLSFAIVIIAWYVTRWYLWKALLARIHAWKPEFSSAGYCLRSVLLWLLAVPFLIYPLLALDTQASQNTILFWSGLFFVMLGLSLHFQLTHNLIFFSINRPWKEHIATVIKKGWTTFHQSVPLYIGALGIVILLYYLLSLFTIPAMITRGVLILCGLLLVAIIRNVTYVMHNDLGKYT